MKTYLQLAKEKFEKLKTKKDVIILSVESSCDETSVAVVRNGRHVLSNVIASQIEIHKRFGGVVPEIASRNHVTAISNIYRQALNEANITEKDIDAVAVTYGAGLIGALLVGVNFAKGLAYSLKVPLIAVSHIEGHIAGNYISFESLKPPFVCLMISGGHTMILDVEDYNKYTILGSTLDDAVGECYDKVARVLKEPYPGGPNIDRLASKGKNQVAFNYHSETHGFNFSFSGLKTAVVNYVHNHEQKDEYFSKEDVAYSFQNIVIDELVSKAIKACQRCGKDKLVVAGGVSANLSLRTRLEIEGDKYGIQCYYPQLKYCTDNGAMIGAMAYYYIKDGIGLADLSLTAKPTGKIMVKK